MKPNRKPKIVKAVYDNGGKTNDRYTVVLNERESRLGVRPVMWSCIGLTAGGSSEFSSCQARFGDKKIPWSRLPASVRASVRARLR